MNREHRHLDPVVTGDTGSPDDREPPIEHVRRPIHWSQAVLGLVLFSVSFVAATRLFVPPFPEDDILRAKQSILAERSAEFDGLFLGSSRVYRAFDPRVFEAETGLRILNLGLLYGRPHELDALLQELLERHRPRYVFVELMDWAPSINADLADQDRTLRWHTRRETLSAIRTTWRAEGSTLGRVWTTGEHVGHWLKRTLNFGGGPLRVRAWLGDDEDYRQWREVIAEGWGFVRYEQETDPRYALERRAFLEKYVDDFRRQVATVDARNREPGSLAHFNVEALREQEALIRRHEAEPIYVIPNLRRGTPGWLRLDDEGVVTTLFSFNHVIEFPELYTVEHHFDRRHVNTAGAREFTRRLAERFEGWRDEE